MYRISFFIVLMTICLPAFSCEITMGYRTSARLPLIAAMPSNQGLYKAIYQRAAQNINCKLVIKRAPKKRIIKLLNEGAIDFYPGYGFNQARSEFTHFFENGLTSHSVVITHRDVAKIDNLKQLENKVLLKPYGGRKSAIEERDIMVRYGQDLGIADAIKVIEKKQADFFIYNKASIDYYLAQQPNAQIKIHDCCYLAKPMHFGFSRKSKHYESSLNPNYLPEQAVSVNNVPYLVNEGSVASAFANAVKALAESGVIKQLEQQYYSAALDSEQPASSDISATKH